MEHIKVETNEKIEEDIGCEDTKPLNVNISHESSDLMDNQPKLPCLFCENSFADAKDLDQHTFIHKENELYTCPFCPWKFKSYIDVKKHSMTHYTIKEIFQCKVCIKLISSKKKLTSHMKIHNKGFVCSQCGKHLNSAKDFRIHKEMHVEPKKKCHFCQKIFPINYIQRHNKVCHPNNIRKQTFICDMCGKSLKCITQYKAHLQVHNPFECDICEKRFTRQSSLDLHKKIHTNVELIKCRYCYKAYSRRYATKKHEEREHLTSTDSSSGKAE